MPSLRSWSWESKLAAKGWRWGQKVSTAIRKHVELKTEAPRGLFCVSLLALASLHRLVFQTLCLCHIVFYKGWSGSGEHQNGKGLWRLSCSSPLVFKGRKWKPRGAEWLSRGHPAYGRKAGPEHRGCII